MLTKELAIAECERGMLIPDRLTTVRHARYPRYAEQMLLVYRTGLGRTRQELHRDIHALFAAEIDCPPRRIDAFCKLLDDASTFDQDAAGQAAALRRQLFRRAAAAHPLVCEKDRLFDESEAGVKARIASELGRTWDEIDRDLFADILDFHRLRSFDGYADGRALLSRYNVAQVQVALFDAVSLTVRATADLKTILRYAKLARLMHTIRRLGNGEYEFRFDGPASVLRETRRYGVAMARFLPALLACRGWKLHAQLQPRRGWKLALRLSPEDGLTSHLPAPEEFDSDVEAAFAARWGTEPRAGWTLERETELLHDGQKVFFPDFTFRHADGRQMLLEIVGYWTPDYLAAKLATLQHFAAHPQAPSIVLAVCDSPHHAGFPVPADSLRFKTRLKLNDVLDRLSRLPESEKEG